jgi:Protein of unknown function (DUF3105)
LAKDRTPASGKPGGKVSSADRGGSAGKGRTRPPVNVVTPQRPWGLIAAAIAVAVFAAAVLTYAVLKVNESNADKVQSADEISGLKTFEYAAGQDHVTTPVQYEQSPPVGGPHDGNWADCTGTVYDVDIRHENAVHSLEHGAVWITYNPDELSDDDVATLADLVDGESGRLMSPYAGLDSPISLQSWNHQLKVDSVADKRIKQFADFFTRNGDFYPEVGASCENPAFKASPLVAGDASTPVGPSDMPTTTTPDATTSTEGAPAETTAP